MDKEILEFEAPYPLKQRFRNIVLPSLLFLTVIIGLVMGVGSSWLTQKIYLEISENRAAVINRALFDENGTAWHRLQETTDPTTFFSKPEGQHLLDTLRGEVKELGLSHLKIYGHHGLILYSSEEEQIGNYDPSAGYKNALNGKRTLVAKKRPGGTKLYELYVRVPDSQYNTVMELYEPVGYLDMIALKVVVPAIVLPVSILLFLGWIMHRLVFHAQADINYRTDLLREFRQRLQKLVSNEAVTSLRSSTGKGAVKSRRVKATILFSDIRGFTDFCENETPEDVVAFLNKSLGIVIDAIVQNNGDVDKMIGDAVLAHFQGDRSEKRALQAAREAMNQMKQAKLPRGIGIGIYTGYVVVGTVGAASRMDFTVIGDTVNVASRLCSAAQEGEIIVDDQTYQQIGNPGITTKEQIQVKGRENALTIFRLP
ncbi:adenylate/guanylate cyclase domain-containing protein [Terasakiella sp. A23]|uniref:adenylate/guanylate cyclase domain-containing protein n=1 Tax=Terasakiella sp. FCG-A23 TaxID=3080561 RepID=UPI002952EF38|nr:adenylate/guanylate cyclase domain-containing protein [Terasakiella sp. A23]MDV7340920.1 adenylate/guanylate cyclase domain-containing protein [Terasakiella sp. A23]